jgi:two-component sensor histidine kinase
MAAIADCRYADNMKLWPGSGWQTPPDPAVCEHEGRLARVQANRSAWSHPPCCKAVFDERISGMNNKGATRHGPTLELVHGGFSKPRIAEADHRVANSLNLVATMLRMQRERSTDRAVRSAILGAESRVVSIAKFHSYLHRRGSHARVDLADFFREILPEVGSAIGIQCLLAVNAPAALTVSERMARQLMIMVNELALNALKHGYDGREGGCISVELDIDDDRLITISFADSGNGLPYAFDPENTRGLGLRIVSALVHELGGTLACRSDGGAQFTITIPAD